MRSLYLHVKWLADDREAVGLRGSLNILSRLANNRLGKLENAGTIHY